MTDLIKRSDAVAAVANIGSHFMRAQLAKAVAAIPVITAGDVEGLCEELAHKAKLMRSDHRITTADTLDEAATTLTVQAAEIGALRETLKQIDYHKDNQDMNHLDFRIHAGNAARAALEGRW